MEGLYKVDNVIGKGLGWIALQDIKVGTLIWKEKPQFIPQKVPHIFSELPVLMDTWLSMSEIDQNEFLNLSNSFLDLDSLNDEMREYYYDVKKFVQNQNIYLSDSNKELMLKIICIHQTNSFGGVAGRGVGIKISRINHSCSPNCENIFNDGEIEITANQDISAGQEITISYINDFKNFKERQENCHKLGFVCSCELCKDEEVNNDDESYERFQNLQEEAEKSYATFLLDKDRFMKNYDEIKKAISCRTKMYNLAGKKKAPKAFTHQILNQAFMYGSTGKKPKKFASTRY